MCLLPSDVEVLQETYPQGRTPLVELIVELGLWPSLYVSSMPSPIPRAIVRINIKIHFRLDKVLVGVGSSSGAHECRLHEASPKPPGIDIGYGLNPQIRIKVFNIRLLTCKPSARK